MSVCVEVLSPSVCYISNCMYFESLCTVYGCSSEYLGLLNFTGVKLSGA